LEKIHPQAQKGIDLFNQGDFHAAHEYLELAWMDTFSPEKDLYQGILQIGLAYFQISRGNFRGALKMFRRGQRNLALLGDSLLGVNLKQLREDARQVETKLREINQKGEGQLTGGFSKPLPLIDQGNRL
jgi:predicted metal-dependent hydrolase